MEFRDLYDGERRLTGEKIAKGQNFPQGRYILVVIVFIENEKGELLLQKRSAVKGGKWATTGGHPKSGESSLEGMMTELEEELGIKVEPEALSLFKTLKTDKTFIDLYYLKKDVELKDLKLQKQEVEDARFFNPKEVEKLMGSDEFFLPHLEAFNEFLLFKKS